ncbi:hypothetical protein DTO195F2_6893 [Paecilomyces variotii]|nr:hypothetical protein DTO195F2_6893 [Paecilomyces variotii]
MSGSSPPDINSCEVPALQPPPGQVSNFVNPVNLVPLTWSISLVLTIFAVSLVILRLFMNMRKLDAADYFMAVGGMFSIAYTGIVMSLHRYNRHQWDVPACWVNARYLRLICAGDTVTGAVNFFPKCSILLMYRRLFPNKSMRIGTWIGFVSAFCIYFSTIPVLAVYEVPRSGHTWDQFLNNLVTSEGHAMLYLSIVQGSCSVVLDLYIFLLPPPTLFKLKLPLRKRLQLLALFATALLGVIASAISLVFRCEPLHSSDSTWNDAQLAICIVFETNVAIAVGSMPIIAKFVRSSHIVDSFRRLRSKLLGRSCKDRSYPISPSVPGPFNPKNTRRKPLQLNHYDEFTDTMLLVRTQVTAADEENPPVREAINTNREGIIQTVDITQQSQLRNQSLSQEQHP